MEPGYDDERFDETKTVGRDEMNRTRRDTRWTIRERVDETGRGARLNHQQKMHL